MFILSFIFTSKCIYIPTTLSSFQTMIVALRLFIFAYSNIRNGRRVVLDTLASLHIYFFVRYATLEMSVLMFFRNPLKPDSTLISSLETEVNPRNSRPARTWPDPNSHFWNRSKKKPDKIETRLKLPFTYKTNLEL